jgi:hypothetical protein
MEAPLVSGQAIPDITPLQGAKRQVQQPCTHWSDDKNEEPSSQSVRGPYHLLYVEMRICPPNHANLGLYGVNTESGHDSRSNANRRD